jgi:hypothetical protein
MERKIFLIVFIAFILVLGLGFFYNKLFVFGRWGYEICPNYKCEERWGPPDPPECYNAAIPGYPTYCGPACPYMYYPSSYNANVGYELGNGLPWAKYEITSNCIAVPAFPEEAICFWQTNIVGSSLGDKLEPGCPRCGWAKKGYLAAGRCQPWESGGFYKVCCGPDGRVEPSAVSYFELDNRNPPTEGYCPNDPYGRRVGYSSSTGPNVGEPHPACGGGVGGGGGGGGGAPPPPPPKQEVVRTETCNFQGTFSASPTSGNLDTRFNITYGVTQSGRCDCINSGTLYVTLNLDNIRKDWGETKNQSFSHSFTTGVSGGSRTVTFEPQYHGHQNFSVNVSGNVSPCQITNEYPDRIEIINVTPNYINVSGSILVNPTDVTPLNPTVTSSTPTPPSGTYKTPLRQFIAGFPHFITYGIRLNSPFVFKLDDGRAIGSMTGPQSFSASFPLQNTSGSSPITKTATFTPTLAGQYTISSCHNADDERFRAPDNECQSTTITVYRYLCYQGFCFECPREPQLRGVYLDVKGAGCQPVEDVKCQTYIRQSCRAGVRE